MCESQFWEMCDEFVEKDGMLRRNAEILSMMILLLKCEKQTDRMCIDSQEEYLKWVCDTRKSWTSDMTYVSICACLTELCAVTNNFINDDIKMLQQYYPFINNVCDVEMVVEFCRVYESHFVCVHGAITWSSLHQYFDHQESYEESSGDDRRVCVSMVRIYKSSKLFAYLFGNVDSLFVHMWMWRVKYLMTLDDVPAFQWSILRKMMVEKYADHVRVEFVLDLGSVMEEISGTMYEHESSMLQQKFGVKEMVDKCRVVFAAVKQKIQTKTKTRLCTIMWLLTNDFLADYTRMMIISWEVLVRMDYESVEYDVCFGVMMNPFVLLQKRPQM